MSGLFCCDAKYSSGSPDVLKFVRVEGRDWACWKNGRPPIEAAPEAQSAMQIRDKAL